MRIVFEIKAPKYWVKNKFKWKETICQTCTLLLSIMVLVRSYLVMTMLDFSAEDAVGKVLYHTTAIVAWVFLTVYFVFYYLFLNNRLFNRTKKIKILSILLVFACMAKFSTSAWHLTTLHFSEENYIGEMIYYVVTIVVWLILALMFLFNYLAVTGKINKRRQTMHKFYLVSMTGSLVTMFFSITHYLPHLFEPRALAVYMFCDIMAWAVMSLFYLFFFAGWFETLGIYRGDHHLTEKWGRLEGKKHHHHHHHHHHHEGKGEE